MVLALLLTPVSPATLDTRPSDASAPDSSIASPAWVGVSGTLRPASEAPAGSPAQRATTERFGWASILSRAAPGPSDIIPLQAHDGRPTLRGSAVNPWPVTPGTAPLMALVAYRPNAPPTAR